MFKYAGLVWLALLIFYLYRLYRLRSCQPQEPENDRDEEAISLSIVIPFRNESENLPALLQSLDRALPASFPVEIIGVDDASEDDSVTIFKQYTSVWPSRVVRSQRKSISGKRDAQTTGIAAAKGRWILLLDADTEVPETYFENLVQSLRKFPKASLRIGQVQVKANEHKFWPCWQAYENAYLQALGYYSALCGMGLMANGAHLLFRKDRFEALGGFSKAPNTAGGDDMFLLIAWKKQFQDEIIPLDNQPGLVVTTTATKAFGRLLAQRIRWARKTRILNDQHIRHWSLMQAVVYSGYFISLGTPCYWIAGNLLWWAGEKLFAKEFFRNRRFDSNWKKQLGYHLLRPVIYLVVLVGIWLPIPLKWKGRQYKI